MNFSKLVPWNWFGKEDEQDSKSTQLNVQHLSQPNFNISPFYRLEKEFNNTLSEMMSSLSSFSAKSSWLKPTVDISASDKNYLVLIEVPGVDEKDVKIELSGNVLTIKGEKKEQIESSKDSYYKKECSYGYFQRVLNIPDDADSEKIEAKFNNGTIKITIPKLKNTNQNIKTIPIIKGS